MLNNDQILRYSRHILLPEISGKGQEKLFTSKVLVVGAGGLGSPVTQYIAAAGVGKIGIMDGDNVDLSNLQRQIIHTTADIGKNKADSAREKIELLNPDVCVKVYPYFACAENIEEVLHEYDIVIDCCDNFSTRYIVNDAAVLLKKPYFYGGVLRFDGQASVFYPPKSPCYRCIFGEAPPPGSMPSCQEAGVFNVLPGIIGLVQAAEALKWLLETGETLLGRLLTFNALNMEFRNIKINRRMSCEVCGENPSISRLCSENYEMMPCENV